MSAAPQCLAAFVRICLAPMHGPARPTRSARPASSSDWDSKTPVQQAETLTQLADALKWIDADSYVNFIAVGQALCALGEPGRQLWMEWIATSTRFPGGDGHERFDTFTGERTSYAAIFKMAEAASAGQYVNPARGTRPSLPEDASQVFAGATLSPLPAGIVTTPPASVPEGLTNIDAAKGYITANVGSVYKAVSAPESGVRLAYDEFQQVTSIERRGHARRPLVDEDYGHLRRALEDSGFRSVSAEVIRTVVSMLAKQNAFNSAVQRAEALIWDGVPRIDLAMVRYYGCADTPYARAVGAYKWTALAGRALVPGIKADMAIILVGLQGDRKTSAVQVLSPVPEAFGELDLSKKDDALSRALRGKQVMELAELRGLGGRDADSNKAFISRQFEEYRPLFRESLVIFGRQCLIVGTTNSDEFLNDPTGERRYLPIHVGKADIEALARDRDQLWAEGVARFKADGIAWQQAEELARAEHSSFAITDERQALVADWLAASPPRAIGDIDVPPPRCTGPVRLADVAVGALNFQSAQLKPADQTALIKIMRNLGWQKTKQRIHGRVTNVWINGGTA